MVANCHVADAEDVSENSQFNREQFVLDEVLQLVAERALAITGADGLVIALAEKNEIVLRAAAGTVRPDLGAHIDRDSVFSGACFRMAQIARCDDTEADARVNPQACRRLGARSMIAVPLCARRRVIGLLEAFSSEPFRFKDSDVRNLSLLADLVVGALNPEEEDCFAESAQVAAKNLEASLRAPEAVPPTIVPPQVGHVEPTPAVPVVIRKPLEAEVTSSPAAAILHEPGLEPEKTPSEFEPGVATETAAEPEVPAEEDSATHRPAILVALVCMVIAVAFAGRAWWKLKTVQLGSVIEHMEKTVPKPDATSDGGHATKSPTKRQGWSKFSRVTGIRHWSSADSSTVVLNVEDQVQYEAHRLSDPDRIYFDLHDTQLASDLAGKSIEVGDALLNRIRVGQPVAGITRLVLDTKAHTDFSVNLEPNPYRLVVEVRKVEANPRMR